MSWLTEGDELWPVSADSLRELWTVYWSECVIQVRVDDNASSDGQESMIICSRVTSDSTPQPNR